MLTIHSTTAAEYPGQKYWIWGPYYGPINLWIDMTKGARTDRMHAIDSSAARL